MSSNINIIKYNKSTSILFNSYSRIGTEVLSNLHQCKLSYEGKNFNSSEQLFFWLRLYGNPEYQELLLKIETPKEVKNRGRVFLKNLKVEETTERKVQLLRLAIKVKYNCCDQFRQFLISHPNTDIVEYAWWGDDFYGCVDEDINFKYNWKKGYVTGKNVCGRLIKEIRDEKKDDNGMCILTRPACLDMMMSQTLF